MTRPLAFQAWDDTAAYVDNSLTRAKAMTAARDVHWSLRDDWTRGELHVVRVYMREIGGAEAREFFEDDFEKGWVECSKGSPGAFPMWKVEPK